MGLLRWCSIFQLKNIVCQKSHRAILSQKAKSLRMRLLGYELRMICLRYCRVFNEALYDVPYPNFQEVFLNKEIYTEIKTLVSRSWLGQTGIHRVLYL